MFSSGERAAFAPPEVLTPVQWAEKRAIIPRHKPLAGRYSFSATPYLREIADSIIDPNVRQVVVIKAVRVGYTSMLANLIGWAADQQGSPMMLVLPNDTAGTRLIDEDIRPTLEASGLELEGMKDEIQFLGCTLHLGYSTSPQSLASRSIRYAFLDEVDKGASYNGKDTDFIRLASARTIDWGHRARIVIGSSPTTRDNYIYRLHSECGDKRVYYVPCPHCSHYQNLIFPHIKWPDLKASLPDKVKRAEKIGADSLAWYECEGCGQPIRNQHKAKMVSQGLWLSEGQSIEAGTVKGARPAAKSIGYHISALYSPFVSFSQLAEVFIKADGSTAALFDFRTNYLGEVFEDRAAEVRVDDLRARLADAPPADLVPRWATRLVMTTDTQKNHFYYILRAWGGDRNQMVRIGVVTRFDDLTAILNTRFKVADTDELMSVYCNLIDTGGTDNRTREVYEYCQTDPNRIRPIKGNPTLFPDQMIKWSDAQKDRGLKLMVISTQDFKKDLNYLVKDHKLEICKSATQEYFDHLESMTLVYDGKGGRAIWQPRSEGTPDHFNDCEVYQMAAAYWIQAHTFPTEAQLKEQWAQQNRSLLPTEVKLPTITRPASNYITGKPQNAPWFK